MSGNTGGKRGDERQSALWGSGNRGGEFRTSALWGKGRRGVVVTLLMGVTLSIAAGAVSARGTGDTKPELPATYVSPGLLEKAEANPKQKFQVIVHSVRGADAAERSFESVEREDDERLAKKAEKAGRAADAIDPSKALTKKGRETLKAEKKAYKELEQTFSEDRGQLKGELLRDFEFIGSVNLEITGRRLAELAKVSGLSITEDVPTGPSDLGSLKNLYKSSQLWPHESGVTKLWEQSNLTPTTIAIVDSGVDAARSDIAGRVLKEVNFVSSGKPNASGDGRGHGTFVAGIAAGAAPGYAGAAPHANIVSLDVMDDSGSGRTSDVIAAAKWIYENKDTYGIRVANFSLHSASRNNFYADPLNQAVEKLWFAGVVVVAAAGNYGTADGPSGVKYAPGNDPFVITVGAADIGGTAKTGDDARAPWSAYGRTDNGFWKPELCAPGRYMVGPVPMGSTLARDKADKLMGDGYIELSGTSFAAPVISGVVAHMLARNPHWSPDKVKGALMKRTRAVPKAAPLSCGVGQINAVKSATELKDAPNPNAGLNRFLKQSADGQGTVFDAVSWTDVSWTDVSWDAVSWSDVSWSDVSWSDVSWSDVSWSDVSWSDVSWSDVSYEDGADGDEGDGDGYFATEAEADAAAADPDLMTPEELAAMLSAKAALESAPEAPALVDEPALPVPPVTSLLP
jgi:serine protease AprX